ncbi:MAG: sugar phosphate nucleotidyltransferase [Lachnospiraceae bacterium]|nr:sugar phosphate nucleotidyltransferase [Lachnospiraceae bacterium]
MKKSIMGFIPAGGKGVRMKPFMLIKELWPFIIQDDGSGGHNGEVTLLIENAMNVLHKGGVENVVCTINSDKEMLIKILSDINGQASDMKVSFVHQKRLDKEYGLPFAIAAAEPFLKEHTVFMKFPDTVVYPMDCFKSLYKFHCDRNSDLTLGVFPTNRAENLGPVVIDKNNKILKLEDKPKNPSVDNTWNILIWENSFLNLLMQEVNNFRNNSIAKNQELKIYDIVKKAIDDKLNINAYLFENGKCIDISSIHDAALLWEIENISN